jgi:hypothetical protein
LIQPDDLHAVKLQGIAEFERDQIESARGDFHAVKLQGVAEFEPRSAREGRSLRGALFTMGARKKLSQSIGLSAQ